MAVYNAEQMRAAKKMKLRTSLEGQGIQITYFEVGKGGHDVNNVEISLTPDSNLESLPEKVFGPKQFLPTDLVYANGVATINVTLLGNEANGPLSSIMIYAKVISSPIPNDPLIDTVFPYALINLPLQVKVPGEIKTYPIVLRV